MGVQEVGTAARGLRAPDGTRLLRQTYEPAALPHGVVVLPQRVLPDDWGGSFKELVRLEGGVVQLPQLRERGIEHRPAQLNVSVVSPGTRKFWHVHPSQHEMWAIGLGQLNAGLVDCREQSPTYGLRAKVVLTPQTALYIPSGVAHGYANESGATALLIYLPDRHWSGGDDTEEWRIDPQALPFDFVLAETL
ncbi:MAG TPA: dTDP-4-dehydrorhamnose 3,5-epimerase family protein [Chloroflexota bacterium]|nr:dTDP-4-dehydrorhamnose 3,5-epimerase family protein [Chloroflexota bacterium]